MVTAGLVVIGDELLSGRVQDSNSVFLCRRLHDLGVELAEVCTIPDRRDAIKQALACAIQDFDVTLASGGLGPTPDDLTKGVAAKLFNKRLVLDESVADRIEKHFEALGRPVPAASTKQALVPQGAVVLENPVGLAPGLVLMQERRSLILLPGVPLELEKVFETGVVPFLEETYFLSPLMVTTIRTTGVPESEIMERISSYFTRHKTVQAAYLASTAGVDVKLWTENDRRALNECQEELVSRMKPYVYGYNHTNIEDVVGEILRERHLTLCTAESCTGGLIGDLVTNVPGSSAYYQGGVVSYSNDLKKCALGVTETFLRKFGAVSKEVVGQMAGGARDRFGTDYALAVSGIAGPGGGTDAKPVGLVYAGVAAAKKLSTTEFRFTGTRRMIKEQAATRALDYLRRVLQNGPA